MGTTSVKNVQQFEVLPTTSVTPSSGSQLVSNAYITNAYNAQSTVSITGNFLSNFLPFTCFMQKLFVSGAFTEEVRTLSNTGTSVQNFITLDFGNIQAFSTSISWNMQVLTSFSAPNLKYIVANFTLNSRSVLSMTLPELTHCTANFVFSGTNNNIDTFTFGPNLKQFESNLSITPAKLTQASVDNILVRLAALDGTNGTTVYSSRTITLNGGTSSAPSATGLAAKTVLQARSCTVTTN